MNKIILFFVMGILLISPSCNNETDLFPLSEGSADLWYSDETEIEMTLYNLYKIDFWTKYDDNMSDDWLYRESLSNVTAGTVNSEWSTSETFYTNGYKVIARANTILEALEQESIVNAINATTLEQYRAEARFVRGAQYGNLIALFGDVVYVDESITIDEAYSFSRTDKETVLQYAYEDLDYAAENLPLSYSSSETSRATKAAAYALKARYALYQSDWDVAAEAAKNCMDLETNSLHESYSDLFMQFTKNSSESIFLIPRSVEYDSYIYSWSDPLNMLPRNHGGWGAYNPSWDLAASYLCTDGKPIDESSLYDPCNPFNNRDPRMAMTIVEVGSDVVTNFLGIEYNPSPYATTVYNYNTEKSISNNDSRAVAQYAAYNGLLWRKGIDETYLTNSSNTEPDHIYIRLADVMLMYAEAKIELNQIDQTVLDAINMVRARAYGVDYQNTVEYPAVTETDQSSLRTIIRYERRMEFANEDLRYMDLIRWKLAEKALTQANYGLAENSILMSDVVDKGLWFFPGTPDLDDNGIPDYSTMAATGLIKAITQRSFDSSKQYLWPIPSSEIKINENMTQNTGY